MTHHKLVIAEKPSVAQSIAAVLGATKRSDGYLSGNGYLVSWCYGHLAELAGADVYDEKYAKWRYDDLPILPANWRFTLKADKAKQFELLRDLMRREDVTEVINACDAQHPAECFQLDADPDTGGMEFSIRKGRLSFRLTAPYSEKRKQAASEAAKRNGFTRKP